MSEPPKPDESAPKDVETGGVKRPQDDVATAGSSEPPTRKQPSGSGGKAAGPGTSGRSRGSSLGAMPGTMGLISSGSKTGPSNLTKMMNDLVPQLAAEQEKKEKALSDAAAAPPMTAEGEESAINYKEMTIEEILAHFGVTAEKGLSTEQVAKQLEMWGPNALPDVPDNKCLKFLMCVLPST